MADVKTIDEALQLLREGKTLRYYYLIGSVIFTPEYNEYPIIGISIADFLKLRSDGIIDCEDGVKHRDHELMRSEYQRYTLSTKTDEEQRGVLAADKAAVSVGPEA